jgi:Winged helix-turn helix
MARIVEHLPVEDLEARYRAARDVAEARHAQAIWLLAQGRTVLEVSEVLAFAPRWVTRLAARYNASGPAALGDRRRHNGKAASLLTPDLLAALAERVRMPPEDGGLWSGPKAALWVRGTAPDAAGWRGGSAWRRCMRSAVGRRCSGSAGRSRRRGRGTRAPPCPSSEPTSKGA